LNGRAPKKREGRSSCLPHPWGKKKTREVRCGERGSSFYGEVFVAFCG